MSVLFIFYSLGFLNENLIYIMNKNSNYTASEEIVRGYSEELNFLTKTYFISKF